MSVKIKVAILKEPCSACFIIGGIAKELFEKLQRQMDYIEIEYIELENLKNIHSIEGLEVESFPAIIINGEQITAGTVPDRKEIIKRIEWEKENEH